MLKTDQTNNVLFSWTEFTSSAHPSFFSVFFQIHGFDMLGVPIHIINPYLSFVLIALFGAALFGAFITYKALGNLFFSSRIPTIIMVMRFEPRSLPSTFLSNFWSLHRVVFGNFCFRCITMLFTKEWIPNITVLITLFNTCVIPCFFNSSRTRDVTFSPTTPVNHAPQSVNHFRFILTCSHFSQKTMTYVMFLNSQIHNIINVVSSIKRLWDNMMAFCNDVILFSVSSITNNGIVAFCVFVIYKQCPCLPSRSVYLSLSAFTLDTQQGVHYV